MKIDGRPGPYLHWTQNLEIKFGKINFMDFCV